jgi:hypothetical protein
MINKGCKPVSFLLMLLLFCSTLSGQEGKKVIVVPFDNTGDIKMDYLSDHIAASFISLLKDFPGYVPVAYNNLKEYMKQYSYGSGDLDNPERMRTIASGLEAEIIVSGEYRYNKETNYLKITIVALNASDGSIFYRSNYNERCDSGIYETLDTLSSTMVQDFAGLEMTYGYVNVQSDYPCILYVDGHYVGKAPGAYKLVTGKHDVKIAYENDNTARILKEQAIDIVKNGTVTIKTRVFVKISIGAERECHIYLDNEEKGETPYQDKLLSGHEYNLLITTMDLENSEIHVEEQLISTKKEEDVSLFFPVTGKIIMPGGRSPLKGGIVGNPYIDLPASFESLTPGNYHIQMILDDLAKKKKYIIHDHHYYLNPQETKIIDINNVLFTYNAGLCFIPSAAQFHNREPVKGWIILSLFLSFCAGGCITYVVSDYFFHESMDEQYPYPEQQDLYTTGLIFFISSMSAFGIAGGIYIYSLVDGWLTMDRLYHLMHQPGP